MRTIILGIFILFSMYSFSQKLDFKVLSNEIVLGKSLLDSSEIKGIEYIFPERIEETYLDTITGFLTVQLRKLSKNGKWLNNFGNILLYDLNKKKLKWNKKIAYQTSNLQQFSNTMIYTTYNNSYCLDIDNGNELWKVKNDIYFVDPKHNIGIGYRIKSLSGNKDELEGINLKNGEVIWKKELNREYTWNNVFYTNDSTLIVAAAGLHCINIKNGSGWDYHTITGKKDYTETIAKNVAGIALGVLTGVGVVSTGHNLVRDIVSNVLVDSLNLYLSSKDQLVKINKDTGEVIWNHPFQSDLQSKSSIFMNDSLVFMINKGYAYMGNRQLNFGTPFIAAFNKDTGEQKYLSLINVKDDPILGFHILDKEIYLVFKNRLAKYSQETGDLVKEMSFSEQEYGALKYFVGNQVFGTNENGDLRNLIQSDTTKVFVFTNNNKIVAVDNQLNITKTIDFEDLNIYYLKTKGYKFFAKDKLTLIIDNEGKKVAEIEVTSKAFLIGETLYDRQENSFFAINLTEIINKD
ncbi:MAG TPA: PQQ-binding-like beta-propeller repeat protein [Yeosuana sp.]